MPTYFQRPDNALKRANEFIYVEKSQRALDALYDVIKSKKHRTWQKVHENIMLKYLELCVDLRKSHVAKEGLYQYKNICQQMYIRSLEDVVRKYLSMAEERTEEARSQSHTAVINVDDLDVIVSPESLLLSAVSGEDSQDRTDRTILIPWVKFLWESYRQCLELLRNNNRVETLYRDIAQQAFKFCLKYDRKTEFRKLCENLRMHLGHIQKHQNQQTSINMKDPESLAIHMEIRISQLDSAIQMELWQEAFKAVEDIYGLVTLSKKPPKPSLMATYYQKLGLVFWKSGNQLFHAAAWHRLYHLYREQKKGMSAEDLQKMASRVVVATLAVPNPPRRDKLDVLIDQEVSTTDKQRRLATLLSLNQPPTRVGLVKDLSKFSIISSCPAELQELYHHLEIDFNPLRLAEKIGEPLKFIEGTKDLHSYVPALHQITIMQVIKQVSQVYDTIEFTRLLELLPFTDSFHLEHMVVEAARSLDLQVRIDHRTRSLSFGSDLGMAPCDDSESGHCLQPMPSEQIRAQLTGMANALNVAKTLIQSKLPGPEMQRPIMMRADLRRHLVQTYKNVAKRQHQTVLQRRQIIEDRKEELENINNQREFEEAQKLEEERAKQAAAERERLDREMEERARQRREEERREIAIKHAKEKLEQLKKSDIGARAFKDIDESHLAELDPDEIVAKQVRQIEKEKRELQDKLRAQEKKVDHLARAKHEESITLYEEIYQQQTIKAREFWDNEESERIETLVAEHENALSSHERLIRMKVDRDAFVNNLKEARKSVHKEKLKEFEKRLLEERKKRLEERKQKRKEDRRTKWLKEKEEEEQRKRDEALIKEKERQEEEERRKDEERSRMAEKQRLREEEIEKKQREADQLERDRAVQKAREMQAESRAARDETDAWKRPEAPSGGGSGNAWRPGGREGGWRERVKTKDERWSGSRDGPPGAPARDEGPPRRDGPPDDEEPPRKTYAERREESYRDARLDDDSWRPRRDEGPPRRDEGPPRRDEGPPRRDEGPPRRDEGPPRRDEGPPRRDEGPPRRDEGPPSRDEGPRRFDEAPRREPGRDEWRRSGGGGGGGGGERDAWRSPRGGPRDGPRDLDRRRDDRGPPRDLDRRRDDRGPRDFDRGPSRDFERGPPRDFERGPPRDFERGPSRDFERGPSRDFDRGPSRDFERGPPRDFERGPPRGGREEGGSWRRGEERRAPPRNDDPPRKDREDDGWTQVRS